MENSWSKWERFVLFPSLVLLLGLFVAVMICSDVEKWLGGLLDLKAKNEILQFLGFGMGGVLLVLQAFIANRRAKAMEDAANEQAKANLQIEDGQRQERLKNAIEHLGHDAPSVRLGAAYELFHLAKDVKGLRQTVWDVLCAHVRGKTNSKKYKKKFRTHPSEEIQSLLSLLFVQKHTIFRGLRANLQHAHLVGVNLEHARLQNALLNSAFLLGSDLSEAQLQGAECIAARLQDARLFSANLQGANLCMAKLHRADLPEAQLQGAIFHGTEFHEAHFLGTMMQGVTTRAEFVDGFEENIREQIGQKSDLSGAIFCGARDEKEFAESIKVAASLLLDAKEFEEKMNFHIGRPASHKLPAGNKIAIGEYTAEEAEAWIREYNEATKPDVAED